MIGLPFGQIGAARVRVHGFRKWHGIVGIEVSLVAALTKPGLKVAGEEVELAYACQKVQARRIRIWAKGSCDACEEYRGEDLWLVEEQTDGSRWYAADQCETYSFEFNKAAPGEEMPSDQNQEMPPTTEPEGPTSPAPMAGGQEQQQTSNSQIRRRQGPRSQWTIDNEPRTK